MMQLQDLPDELLVAELRRRGFTVTPPAPTAGTLEAFRAALYATLERLDAANRHLGLVPIPAVRQALHRVAPGETFDAWVLELARRREVVLVWHDRPAQLSPAERAACIRDPALGQLYYWFRWGM